jgi:parallel beta-helix repeat protein
MKRKCCFSIGICLWVFLFPDLVKAQTSITDCTTISSPGKYALANSITAMTEVCINITSSNVILDGGNYTIRGGPFRTSGKDSLVTRGVTVSNVTHVTLQNIQATNWSYGIHVDHCDRVTIRDSTASSNGIGIYLSTCEECVLLGNSMTGNIGDAGINLEHSSHNTLTGNAANSNFNVGFYVEDGSHYNTLSNNTATTNIYGFKVSDASHHNTYKAS